MLSWRSGGYSRGGIIVSEKFLTEVRAVGSLHIYRQIIRKAGSKVGIGFTWGKL